MLLSLLYSRRFASYMPEGRPRQVSSGFGIANRQQQAAPSQQLLSAHFSVCVST
jgi:hypothetical protein